MSRWIKVTEDINSHIINHLKPEDPVLQALHEHTAGMQMACKP